MRIVSLVGLLALGFLIGCANGESEGKNHRQAPKTRDEFQPKAPEATIQAEEKPKEKPLRESSLNVSFELVASNISLGRWKYGLGSYLSLIDLKVMRFDDSPETADLKLTSYGEDSPLLFVVIGSDYAAIADLGKKRCSDVSVVSKSVEVVMNGSEKIYRKSNPVSWFRFSEAYSVLKKNGTEIVKVQPNHCYVFRKIGSGYTVSAMIETSFFKDNKTININGVEVFERHWDEVEEKR